MSILTHIPAFGRISASDVEPGTKSISLEELRKVLGLESIKDAEANVIQKAPFPAGRTSTRALDVAIAEINKKTDLWSKLASIERSKHSVDFS